MKTCSECGETKSLEDFHRHPDNKDGRQSNCKTCRLAWAKKWRKSVMERNAIVEKTGKLHKCRICGERKPDTEFGIDRSCKHGLKRMCKLCESKVIRESKFGISIADQERMLEIQRGRCPICLRELNRHKVTHLDHCHSTGKVRGILCGPCNQAIGLLKESTDSMMNAIRYLNSQGISI